MGNWRPRVALWGLVALLLVGTLAVVPGAWAGPTDPTYMINGSVLEPGPVPVPAGVTVDLESQASHAIYSTTTYGSGLYSFTSSTNAPTLAPGWWGIWVPAQAKARLPTCNPCAVVPLHQNPTWYWLNSTVLTSTTHSIPVNNVTTARYDSWVFGNVTVASSGKPAAGANVQLLVPTYTNFVLTNMTTNRTGSFNFSVPSTNGVFSRLVLETILPGAPGCTACNSFNYTPVTGLNQSRVNLNIAVGPFLTFGWIYQAQNPTAPVPTGGNVTLFDTANGYIYNQATPPGGFYSVGTYPAGFLTHGAQTFDVIVNSVGYGTAWYPLTVSAANPTGGSNPRSSVVPAIAPPSTYHTTLNFSSGFGNLSVSTIASLSNYSVFPELPNASVGQLWAQLGLAFQNSISFSSAGLPAVYSYVQSSGPFFPAGQAQLNVTTSTPTSTYAVFNETNTAAFTSSSTCSGTCTLSTGGFLNYTWAENYTGYPAKSLATGQKTYSITFVFRHPTHAQAFNYSIILPAGYVLAANTPAPAQTQLLPAGPGGTWTNFTLVSLPSATPYGTATFSLVRYSGVTAIVNASVANFAFSTKNVLNSTNGNYSVIVGAGENVTFTGVNSTFPAGTNGTRYQWNFGDGSPTFSRTTPNFGHVYAAAGNYTGTFTLTNSAGQTNATRFQVFVGATPPVAVISSNATALQQNHTAASVLYLTVPWGWSLKFNATNSSSVLFPNAPVKGIISVANFNISAGKSYWHVANYSWGAGANPSSPFVYTFLGNGPYLSNGTIGAATVPFLGWQYNLTLTVWDGGGLKNSTKLVILVKDSEKPTAVTNVADINGNPIPSSGVTEQANGSAFVKFNASGSYDPHNGSIVKYAWNLTNVGNTSIHLQYNQTPTATGGIPATFGYWLASQPKSYKMNLTVTDRAGNKAYDAVTFVVAFNVSNRPQLTAANLTTPRSMNEGSSYTIWVNVSNILGGRNSTAQNVTVTFFLLPPSGSGSRNVLVSPSSVSFYNYSSAGVVNSTPASRGLATIPWNHTLRAQISWSPGSTGTFNLWANATSSNEPFSDYVGGANQVFVQVTLNPNPTLTYIYIGAGVAAVAAVIIVLVLFYRSGRLKGRGASKSSGSKAKPSKPAADDDDEP